MEQAMEQAMDFDDRTVLLVEDDRSTATWLRATLESRGATVLWARSVEQARAEAARHRPQLALLDVSGLELVVELRTSDEPCAVVVMSGSPGSALPRAASGLGVAEFLDKPIGLEQLERAVRLADERAAVLRRILAAHEGEVVQAEIVASVERRLAKAMDEASAQTSTSSSLRMGLLASEFGLSARQAQAIAGVAEGLTDADIASALKVSYSRTRQLLSGAFSKLGLRSRNEFIRFLWERSPVASS